MNPQVINKFGQVAGGSGSQNLTDGTADIYIKSATFTSLSANMPVLTNNDATLISGEIQINQVDGLSTILAGTVSNPLAAGLDCGGFPVSNLQTLAGFVPQPNPGAVLEPYSLYAVGGNLYYRNASQALPIITEAGGYIQNLLSGTLGVGTVPATPNYLFPRLRPPNFTTNSNYLLLNANNPDMTWGTAPNQALSTTDNVVFNDVSLTGSINSPDTTVNLTITDTGVRAFADAQALLGLRRDASELVSYDQVNVIEAASLSSGTSEIVLSHNTGTPATSGALTLDDAGIAAEYGGAVRLDIASNTTITSGQSTLYLASTADGLSQATTSYLAATDGITSAGIACSVNTALMLRDNVPRLVIDDDIKMVNSLNQERIKASIYGTLLSGGGEPLAGLSCALNLDGDIFMNRDGGSGTAEIFYASSQGTQLFSSDSLTRLYLNNAAEPLGSGVVINALLPGAYKLPTTDGTASQVLTTDGAGISTFQTPQCYGLFSQTSLQTVANTAVQTSIIGTGQGSLTVPSGYFQNGYSFVYSTGGTFRDSANGQLIRFRLLNGGTLFDTGNLSLSNVNTVRGWNISCQFTYYGGNIITNFSFSYTDGNNDQFGFNNQGTNPINTAIPNTLNLTVQWGTANANNTITSNYGTLTKVF